MSKFTMHIIVPPKLIGTIIELLDNEGILVSVERDKGDHPKIHHRTHTKLRRTVKGYDLVLAKFLEGPQTQQSLSNWFSSMGRAHNSVSPLISVLRANNLIEAEGNAFVLTKAGRIAALAAKAIIDKANGDQHK